MGYLSPIFLEAKFGVPTRISEANFGDKPPTSNMEVSPLGHELTSYENLASRTSVSDLALSWAVRHLLKCAVQFSRHGGNEVQKI